MPWLKCGGLTRFTIFAFICVVLLVVSCTRKHPDQASLSPEESLKSIHVQGDFHVELFASEPLVFDPVEMVFDENGKIYVCEMLDYPDDPPAGKPARSRIVLLEDTDGDGKPDRAPARDALLLRVGGDLPRRRGAGRVAAEGDAWPRRRAAGPRRSARAALRRSAYAVARSAPSLRGAPSSCSTSGTRIEPSSSWKFSIRAIIARAVTAVPFSVCTGASCLEFVR